MLNTRVSITESIGIIMVAPSAWASHILVNSKSEAIQIKDKVSKLKDFQKMARKKAHVHQVKKVEIWDGFAKV